MAVRRKYIRKLTEDLLEKHGVTRPPVPVDQIARKLGAEIRRQPTEADLSGFLLRDTERVIIGVNSNHPSTRSRFTIAHELGHFLLHEGERMHVDRTGPMSRIRLRGEVASQGTDLDEREANLFAAELLMPAKFITRDLEQIKEPGLEDDALMKRLAKSYGVSVQALTFRLDYLGYVSPE
jgi:Zn-dependent peptidase ImmA (M78 family)